MYWGKIEKYFLKKNSLMIFFVSKQFFGSLTGLGEEKVGCAVRRLKTEKGYEIRIGWHIQVSSDETELFLKVEGNSHLSHVFLFRGNASLKGRASFLYKNHDLQAAQPVSQVFCLESKTALMRNSKATSEGVTLHLTSRNKQGC